MRVSSARERLAGCRDALKEAGLPLPDSLVRTLSMRTGVNAAAIQDFFNTHKEVTAIVAFSDLVAYETAAVLARMGLSVPHDISLVGFDNICSDMVLPQGLTSVSVAKKTMADVAAERLLQKINGETEAPSHTVLPTVLIARDTVKNINEK